MYDAKFIVPDQLTPCVACQHQRTILIFNRIRRVVLVQFSIASKREASVARWPILCATVALKDDIEPQIQIKNVVVVEEPLKDPGLEYST